MTDLNKNAILQGLDTEDIEVLVLDSVNSTNTYAKGLSLKAPTLVVADRQTDGRGRLGKSFYSPGRSGVYMTLAINTSAPPKNSTIRAAVALIRALTALGVDQPSIKWVNDIFLNGKKVAGILSERTADALIIGIGINLTTIDFPEDLATVAGSLGLSCDRNTVISKVVSELLSALADSDGDILSEYKQYLFILGQEVEYIKDGVFCRGIAADINSEGNLIVKSDGFSHILSSGEISLGSNNFTK